MSASYKGPQNTLYWETNECYITASNAAALRVSFHSISWFRLLFKVNIWFAFHWGCSPVSYSNWCLSHWHTQELSSVSTIYRLPESLCIIGWGTERQEVFISETNLLITIPWSTPPADFMAWGRIYNLHRVECNRSFFHCLLNTIS